MRSGLSRKLLLTGSMLTAAALMFLAGQRVHVWSDVQAHIPAELRVDREQFAAVMESSKKAGERIGVAATDKALAVGGGALAQAISFSRKQAMNASPQPVPPTVVESLRDFFPLDTLKNVRWTTAGRRLSLGTVLAGWYYREGAVTLGEVIVFTTAASTTDLQLWAHELTHVRQYEELGVEGFSQMYVTDWAALEKQARDNAAVIALKARRKTSARRSDTMRERT